METWSDLGVFLACVESQGFAEAGRRLGMTRSSVSKAIRRLEEDLGARLFHRTTRSSSLTEEGQAFLVHARRAQDALRAGRAAVESSEREPSGLLRVTAPVSLGRHGVAPILFGLAARYPELELELSLSDQPARLVSDRFDLAVRVGPLPAEGSLVRRHLGDARNTLIASPGYLENNGTPRTVAELRGHRLLGYGRGSYVKEWLLEERGATLEVTPRTLVLDDLDTVAVAAETGLGLAWVPSWIARPSLLARRTVRVMPAHTWGPSRPIHALWPEAPRIPSRVRVAVEALARDLPDLMDPEAAPDHLVAPERAQGKVA